MQKIQGLDAESVASGAYEEYGVAFVEVNAFALISPLCSSQGADCLCWKRNVASHAD